MAQTEEHHEGLNASGIYRAVSLAVAVTNAYTTLLEVKSLKNMHALWASFLPTVHNFNGFKVQIKVHPDDNYMDMFSVSGDYTSPKGPMLGVSTDMTALAAATEAWIGINVTGLHAVRFLGRSASASGTLCDCYCGASS